MQTDPNQSFAIYHDLPINASLHQVFAAISEPAQLINWWPLKCSGTARLGGEYNFYFTPEYDWFGEVSQFALDQAFHIKMTKSDPDWDPTSFGFNLEQSGTGVLLGFSHTGWPACNAHYRQSSFCWAMLLQALKNYVEKQEIIPFEQRQ